MPSSTKPRLPTQPADHAINLVHNQQTDSRPRKRAKFLFIHHSSDDLLKQHTEIIANDFAQDQQGLEDDSCQKGQAATGASILEETFFSVKLG